MAVAYFKAHAPLGTWPIQNKGERGRDPLLPVPLFIAAHASRHSVDATLADLARSAVLSPVRVSGEENEAERSEIDGEGLEGSAFSGTAAGSVTVKNPTTAAAEESRGERRRRRRAGCGALRRSRRAFLRRRG